MNDNITFPLNHSNSTWQDPDDGPSLHVRIVFASLWAFIAVAGVIGNGLVICVAIRFGKLSNVTNCFIVNLAITDIVFLAFCMPLLVAQYTLDHWYFNETFCKLMNFISFVSVLVTVLTLVTMTIDRYIYVVHPFENIKWRKPKTIFLLSLIIWLLSCISASPFYFHYGVTNDTYKICGLLTDENIQKRFRIYTVTLYYFIPLTIILICYTRLLYHVYSKEKKLQPKSKSNVVKWSKKRRTVTRMVAIVTLVFSLCWLPITLCIMSTNVFQEKTPFLYYFKIIANSFAYLNSAVNPIIYAFLNRSFRNNCGSILSKPTCSSCCWKSHSEDEEEHQRERTTKQDKPNPQLTSFYTTRKKTNFSHDNDIPLSLRRASDDDFSDAEDQLPQSNGISPVIMNKTNHRSNHSKDKYKKILVTTKSATAINLSPMTSL